MDELISFETAKVAKEKGFRPEKDWNPEYVSGYYFDDTAEIKKDPVLTEIQEEDWSESTKFLAPTQTSLQKWLREKHNLHVSVQLRYKSDSDSRIAWYYDIEAMKVAYLIKDLGYHFEWVDSGTDFHETFESALEQGLLKAMELI
jgi:hypothetical protein